MFAEEQDATVIHYLASVLLVTGAGFTFLLANILTQERKQTFAVGVNGLVYLNNRFEVLVELGCECVRTVSDVSRAESLKVWVFITHLSIIVTVSHQPPAAAANTPPDSPSPTCVS